jgi:hypothetical protein
MDKLATDATHVVADIPAGAKIVAGGFGVCGVPTSQVLIVDDPMRPHFRVGGGHHRRPVGG